MPELQCRRACHCGNYFYYVQVEATKFTEVGYHGKDVDSM